MSNLTSLLNIQRNREVIIDRLTSLLNIQRNREVIIDRLTSLLNIQRDREVIIDRLTLLNIQRDREVIIDRLTSLLNPQGLLAIMTKRVINPERFANWHYKNDPTHIIFFSENTFQWIANKHVMEFEIIDKDVVFLTKAIQSNY